MVALHAKRWDAEPLASSPRIPDVLAEMAARLPAWQTRGACRTEDPALWFVQRGDPGTEAKAICAKCEVRAECLDYAIRERIEMGIFGGMSPGERRNAKTPAPV